MLSKPHVLTRPAQGKTLYLYLALADEALSVVLVRETETWQSPIYFVSKAYKDPSSNITKVEKVALALVVIAPRLRPYFVAHHVAVRINQPIAHILVCHFQQPSRVRSLHNRTPPDPESSTLLE